MTLNEDWTDMLRVLSDEKVKFLVVGGYAVISHGHLRTTKDIDLWIMPSPDNADAVMRALVEFGAPLFDLTVQDLQREGMVFQIGLPPRRVDVLTSVTGLRFEEAYENSVADVIEGVEVRVLCLDDLIASKKASGRLQDLADAEALEAFKRHGLV